MKTKSKGPSSFAISLCASPLIKVIRCDKPRPVHVPAGLVVPLRVDFDRGEATAGLLQSEPHPDCRKPLRGAQLKYVFRPGRLDHQMEKLTVLAGHAPRLGSPFIHLVQQPLEAAPGCVRTAGACRPQQQQWQPGGVQPPQICPRPLRCFSRTPCACIYYGLYGPAALLRFHFSVTISGSLAAPGPHYRFCGQPQPG